MSSLEVIPDPPAPSGIEPFLAIDQAVLEAIPAGVYVCSADGVVVRFNSRATELWGRVPRPGNEDRFGGAFRLHELDGRPLPLAEAPTQAVLRTGVAERNKELVIERPDGSRVVVLVNVEPLKGPTGRIQGAINCFQDITARKRSEEFVRDSEDRYRQAEQARRRLISIIESSDDAIVSKNLDGVITSWNKGAERLFGYTADEIVGQSIRTLIPEDLQNEEADILARIRRGGPIERYETVRRRKDGSRVDISLTVSPMKDAEGKIVGASKIGRDITDRKRAEDARRAAESQRDLLVAELSHRVKNTLATVISIAHQSFAKGPSIAEARRSFDGRILALAQTHGRLADQNWSGVSFEIMLLDEFAPYSGEDGRNIVLSGPGITLNPRCALVLGMAFHELATNAAKYGALSVKNGVVSVTWEVLSDRNLLIHWAESGGPAVAKPRRSGFGRLLLERTLAADLRGEVRLSFTADGLCCDIKVPLDGHVAYVNRAIQVAVNGRA